MSETDVMYSRRMTMIGAGVAAGAVLLGPSAWAAESSKKDAKQDTKQTAQQTSQDAEISPPEELMRQHAVVGRLLLIYSNASMQEAGATGTSGTTRPSAKVLASTAQMLRTNVDQFHVQLEEQDLFPLFQKANKMTDLIATLHEQHVSAKRLTDSILRETGKGESADMESLRRHLNAYVRMIQAHTAYEETMLYPQIHTVASPQEFARLQKTFLDANRRLLGAEGFAGLVAKVADLERSAGITSLAQFTAQIPGSQTAMGTPTR